MERITLKISDMTVTYGKFKISNISFELKNGDIMGLVGRSGSGKSTLIKAIIGIKSSSGKVSVFVDEKKTPLSKVLGYAPQENALFPFLTLEENLEVFGKLYKMKKNEIIEQSKELLKRLDLEKHKKKRITELSGGMQKRADLAVALLHSPKVIVLDEPFNGLDISLQKFIWDFLKELAKNGRMIIVSSHMLGDVQKNCNQFGLVEEGFFYNTEELIRILKNYKAKNLVDFLEKIFSQDILKND